MVLACHVVFGTYGFWLPNDPRGSGSDYVGAKHLLPFGMAATLDSRRSAAHVTHDARLREMAKESLRYPPVCLNGLQARAVGRGFGRACRESCYRIHACAILPEHVHLVIEQSERDIRRIVGHLKARATQEIKREGLWPDAARPVWAARSWEVYLDTTENVIGCIQYVEENPLKEGKPRQAWSFVVPYEP